MLWLKYSYLLFFPAPTERTVAQSSPFKLALVTLVPCASSAGCVLFPDDWDPYLGPPHHGIAVVHRVHGGGKCLSGLGFPQANPLHAPLATPSFWSLFPDLPTMLCGS